MVVELRERNQSMRLDEISRFHILFFGPRSTFDLVRSGQRSNFSEKFHFLDLHAHSGVSMCRSELKPSPACSPFNSEQDRVLLLYSVAIFSIRSQWRRSRGGSGGTCPPNFMSVGATPPQLPTCTSHFLYSKSREVTTQN